MKWKRGVVIISLVLVLFGTACRNPDRKVMHVAIIIDDGPTENNSERVMEILQQEGIHVTFGSVAENIEARPEIARALLENGNELVNHSYKHRHPAELDEAELTSEIDHAQSLHIEHTGVAPRWYWLPFREEDPRMHPILEKAGLTIFRPCARVSSQDYMDEVDAEAIRANATHGISDGCVIIFHEWRSDTVAQLPAIIGDLKNMGCVFLTFSEMDEYLQKLDSVSSPAK